MLRVPAGSPFPRYSSRIVADSSPCRAPRSVSNRVTEPAGTSVFATTARSRVTDGYTGSGTNVGAGLPARLIVTSPPQSGPAHGGASAVKLPQRPTVVPAAAFATHSIPSTWIFAPGCARSTRRRNNPRASQRSHPGVFPASVQWVGARPPVTLKESLALARLKEDGGQPNATDMVRHISADLESLCTSLRKAARTAGDANDTASVNLLDGYADGQEKTLWMLRAFATH